MGKNDFFFLMLFCAKIISGLLFAIIAQKSKKGTIFYTLVSFNFSSYTISDDITTQPAFTSPKLTTEILEQDVKYVQS